MIDGTRNLGENREKAGHVMGWLEGRKKSYKGGEYEDLVKAAGLLAGNVIYLSFHGT